MNLNEINSNQVYSTKLYSILLNLRVFYSIIFIDGRNCMEFYTENVFKLIKMNSFDLQ